MAVHVVEGKFRGFFKVSRVNRRRASNAVSNLDRAKPKVKRLKDESRVKDVGAVMQAVMPLWLKSVAQDDIQVSIK